MRHALLSFVTLLVTTAAAGQDVEFVHAVERAQADRPAAIQTTARIAPESEPGTPLVIHGRAYGEDGRTPLAGAVIFAYHTDREGLYDRPEAGPHSWRLRGWARTGSDGRFEFRTIRPGAYPSSRVAAHVHFTIFARDARYYGGELEFDDDDLIPARERAESKARGEFGSVRPVRRDGGTEHVDFQLRLDPSQKF